MRMFVAMCFHLPLVLLLLFLRKAKNNHKRASKFRKLFEFYSFHHSFLMRHFKMHMQMQTAGSCLVFCRPRFLLCSRLHSLHQFSIAISKVGVKIYAHFSPYWFCFASSCRFENWLRAELFSSTTASNVLLFSNTDSSPGSVLSF